MEAAIVYIWGYDPPAPQTIGNATRESGMKYDDEAKSAAGNTGFDVETLNRDGTPAWAAPYNLGDAAEFDFGADRARFVGYATPNADEDDDGD